MASPRKCPICGRPLGEALTEDGRAERFKPFCSKRCADLDLGRWLNGSYGIPATESEDDEADRPAEGGPPEDAK